MVSSSCSRDAGCDTGTLRWRQEQSATELGEKKYLDPSPAPPNTCPVRVFGCVVSSGYGPCCHATRTPDTVVVVTLSGSGRATLPARASKGRSRQRRDGARSGRPIRRRRPCGAAAADALKSEPRGDEAPAGGPCLSWLVRKLQPLDPLCRRLAHQLSAYSGSPSRRERSVLLYKRRYNQHVTPRHWDCAVRRMMA